MKRLTIRTNEASISFECESVGDIVRRLAAIEDILGDEYDLDELREMIQAKREGRCVVPPCKVGQKVKVDVRTWGNIWNYKTVENGKFLIGEIVAITKTKKTNTCQNSG